jgi:hypothetical protein
MHDANDLPPLHHLKAAIMFQIRSACQIALISLVACANFCNSAHAIDSEAPSKAAPLLHGGLEHSVTLPALPEEMQGGKPIAPVVSAIKQQEQKYYWYKVEPWMAGSWKTDKVAFSRRVSVDLPNEPIDEEHEFLQEIDLAVVKDSEGQYWNCQLLPRFSGPTHQGYIDTYELTRTIEPINLETLKSHVVELATNANDNNIVEVNQEEHINVYVKVDPNHLRVDQSLVFFDRYGTAGQKRQARITAHRVGEFRQTPDVSVYQSFVNFMQDQKAANRH